MALFVAVDYALVTIFILAFANGVFDPVDRASGGLVTRTLLANLVALAVGVGLVILRVGRLRPGDVGLVRSKLPAGIIFTVGMWLVVQILVLAQSLLSEGTITIDPQWSTVGVTAMLGALIGQLLGNALYEEIGYRGFLFPQVVAKLEHRWPGFGRRAVVVAMVTSQGLFALRHIPIDLLDGLDAVDLAIDLLVKMLIGVIFALLYLRTRNLFMVVGVHALVNAPTSVFVASYVGPSYLALLLALVTIVAWPRVSESQPAVSAHR
jgi:membrane protease YdiL (CAAX protease family)